MKTKPSRPVAVFGVRLTGEEGFDELNQCHAFAKHWPLIEQTRFQPVSRVFIELNQLLVAWSSWWIVTIDRAEVQL